MIEFLRRFFVKDYKNVKNQKVREAHGKLASAVGIASNLVLFIIKLVAGLLSKSISIIADSINNLSDMGSSVVTLVGFKFANMPADEHHPYGHQRIEYIAGLIVSIIIVFVGGTLFISSVNKIIDYEPEVIEYTLGYITIGILTVSILIKLWQSLFNKKIGKAIDSVALEATAADSRNDCISTGVILLGTIVMLVCQHLNVKIPFSLDGVLGILVSLFILFSGFSLVKETVDPLIGTAISKEYVDEIVEFIDKHPMVLGHHDIMCHMYGPTKCFMTAHVEIDSKTDIYEAHEMMDTIEHDVYTKFGVFLTIHMDPIEVGNKELDELKARVFDLLNDLDPNLSFHDFRYVPLENGANLIFDIVVPYKFRLSNEEIIKILEEEMNINGKKYNFVIQFDHKFID